MLSVFCFFWENFVIWMRDSKLNQKVSKSVPFFSMRICNFQWRIQIFQTPSGRGTPIYYSANISKIKKRKWRKLGLEVGGGGREAHGLRFVCVDPPLGHVFGENSQCNRLAPPSPLRLMVHWKILDSITEFFQNILVHRGSGSSCPNVSVDQGGSKIPSRRGHHPPPPRGSQHMILPSFAKNCMKLRTFWAMGGVRRGAPWIRHWRYATVTMVLGTQQGRSQDSP